MHSEAFEEAKNIVKCRYPSVAPADLEKCADSSDLNPALFSFLAYELSLQSRRDIEDVYEFCRNVISDKIAEEIWHEIGPSLAAMTSKERRSLWQLVQFGIDDMKFRVLSHGAWYKHLRPFAVKSESSTQEVHWHVNSKPFRAFVTKVIGKKGEFKVMPREPFPGLDSFVASFNQIVSQFGETCCHKDSNHISVKPFLDWFVSALPKSLQVLKNFLDCDIVQHLLLHCAHVTDQKLKKAISRSGSVYAASYNMFKAARYCRCHVRLGEDTSVIFTRFPVDVNETKNRLSLL